MRRSRIQKTTNARSNAGLFNLVRSTGAKRFAALSKRE
jgi:hypothetical protein